MTDSKGPKSIPIAFDPISDWSSSRTNSLVHGAGELSVGLQTDYSEEANDQLVVRLGSSGTDGTGCSASCIMKMVVKEDADAVVAFFEAVSGGCRCNRIWSHRGYWYDFNHIIWSL